MFEEKRLYLEDPKEIHQRGKFATTLGPSMTSTRPRDRASTTTKKINNNNNFIYIALISNAHGTLQYKKRIKR